MVSGSTSARLRRTTRPPPVGASEEPGELRSLGVACHGRMTRLALMRRTLVTPRPTSRACCVVVGRSSVSAGMARVHRGGRALQRGPLALDWPQVNHPGSRAVRRDGLVRRWRAASQGRAGTCRRPLGAPGLVRRTTSLGAEDLEVFHARRAQSDKVSVRAARSRRRPWSRSVNCAPSAGLGLPWPGPLVRIWPLWPVSWMLPRALNGSPRQRGSTGFRASTVAPSGCSQPWAIRRPTRGANAIRPDLVANGRCREGRASGKRRVAALRSSESQQGCASLRLAAMPPPFAAPPHRCPPAPGAFKPGLACDVAELRLPRARSATLPRDIRQSQTYPRTCLTWNGPAS